MHNTPQHAGVVEHCNWMIGKQICALLHTSGLPKFLWGEAASHIVWLLNWTTTKAVEGMMPFEAAFGKKPDLKKVHEWGEKVYVRIEVGTKLGGRVWEGCWLGIDNESKGAQVYWPDSKTVNVERNIYYDREDENESVGLTKVNPLLGGKGTWSTNNSDSTLAPRIQKPTNDWMAVVEACEDEYAFATEVGDAEVLEPQSLTEAKQYPDWQLWERAIEEELMPLREAGTWEVVDIPKNINIVGSKWDFKAKKDSSGNIVRYKAHLVT